MKKVLKSLGILFVLVLVGLFIFAWVTNEPLPTGKMGKEADTLAQKMLSALNEDAYKNTRYLEWSFANGAHSYKWDKAMGKCVVMWDDIVVHLNLNDPTKSKVFEKEKLISAGTEKTIQKAVDYFNNDSFWLVAPYKVFDKDVERRLVTKPNGDKALLITYKSGGSTPGDSYLWELNDDGFPNNFKMWVKIIPIGGVEATWEDWLVTESGAYLPKSHKLGPITLSMGNVRGSN
ncbi:hypothetical protein GCM10011414_14340 [Croceivirga lutea]|uniref:hypothetical protein n=1 Tax=Croceivirga lutea TaxID=1775167 RepID=UPI0016396AAE|nr:hypothetical protein [Croceivirga lutea]GGG45861.1 hypothetical protein GCM10011414_14340 [Croceivirga lutea]